MGELPGIAVWWDQNHAEKLPLHRGAVLLPMFVLTERIRARGEAPLPERHFWVLGARLSLASVMQVARPDCTSQRIFEIEDPTVLGIVGEVGFGNITMGKIGLASLIYTGKVVPAAVAGGVYYGLAGVRHHLPGAVTFSCGDDFGRSHFRATCGIRCLECPVIEETSPSTGRRVGRQLGIAARLGGLWR